MILDNSKIKKYKLKEVKNDRPVQVTEYKMPGNEGIKIKNKISFKFRICSKL